jgi:hypothetical protein
MAKKKQVSFVGRLEHAAEDVADALSVAATGSQVGVLELAAEDELGIKPVKPRKKPVVAKKKVAARKKAVAKKAAKKPAKKAKAKRR